jgi:hypothetical protein
LLALLKRRELELSPLGAAAAKEEAKEETKSKEKKEAKNIRAFCRRG